MIHLEKSLKILTKSANKNPLQISYLHEYLANIYFKNKIIILIVILFQFEWTSNLNLTTANAKLLKLNRAFQFRIENPSLKSINFIQ